MLFYVGKSISRKLRKNQRSSIHPLNLGFCLEALCMVYMAKLQEFLEEKWEQLVNGNEGNTLDTLVINTPDYDFEYLFESLKTNTSLCCTKCTCSSGSGTSQVLSVKSPGVPDLTPVPIGDGETSGGNLAPTVIDKKSPEKENLSEDPSHGHSEKASPYFAVFSNI